MIIGLAILLAVFLPVSAAAFSGHVAGEYDLLSREWVWEASGYEDVTHWLRVGATLRTHCFGWDWKACVPSWIPYMQGYEVWAEAHYGGWSIRLTDWCDHHFSQSGLPPEADRQGLTMRVQYDF